MDRIDDHFPNELFYPVRNVLILRKSAPGAIRIPRIQCSPGTPPTGRGQWRGDRHRFQISGYCGVYLVFPCIRQRSMAIEIASSPVEQPGTQIRRVEPGRVSWISFETTFSERTSKASGSLKNRVTPMRKSLWRASSFRGIFLNIAKIVLYGFYLVCRHPPFHSSPDGGLLVVRKIDSGPSPDLKKYSCHEISERSYRLSRFSRWPAYRRSLYIAQNSFGHFLDRQDHINKARSNGAPGHSIEFGLIYILNDYHAAFFFTALSPRVPSVPVPERMTQMAFSFSLSAKERKKESIGKRGALPTLGSVE